MNVAIYLRKSREEEHETREETLARHERILTDYCERHGLTVIKKYKEVVSGESIANRPKMQSLLVDAFFHILASCFLTGKGEEKHVS